MVLVLLGVAPLGGENQRSSGAEPVPASSPFVDVHAHLEPADPARSVQAALRAMAVENAAKIVFMPPPFTADDPARYDAEIILANPRGKFEICRLADLFPKPFDVSYL